MCKAATRTLSASHSKSCCPLPLGARRTTPSADGASQCRARQAPGEALAAQVAALEPRGGLSAGGPRPEDSDEDEDGPPGDLYQPSHFQDTQCGDLAQPSHFGTGESLAELSARMSQLESVSRRNTRGSMESAASMRSGPTTASTMRAAAMRAAAKKRSRLQRALAASIAFSPADKSDSSKSLAPHPN